MEAITAKVNRVFVTFVTRGRRDELVPAPTVMLWNTSILRGLVAMGAIQDRKPPHVRPRMLVHPVAQGQRPKTKDTKKDTNNILNSKDTFPE